MKVLNWRRSRSVTDVCVARRGGGGGGGELKLCYATLP